MSFQKAFIFWLSLFPFLVWGSYFEAPKIIWFLAGGFILAFFWVGYFRSGRANVFQIQDFFFWGWLSTLFIASILGANPKGSILGESYRHQGVLFFLALWLVGKTVSLLKIKEKELLIKYLSFGVILESLLVIFQKISGNLYFLKPLGSFGEANAVAGFLAEGLFFLTLFFKEKAWIFSLPVILAGILTGSKSGLAAIILIFISGIFLRGNLKSKWAIFSLAFLVIAGFVFFNREIFMRKTSFFESRPVIWKVGIGAFLKKPFIGYGAETTELIYENSFKEMKINFIDFGIDRSHNLFLDILLWSGIVGFIFFIGWLMSETKYLYAKKNYFGLITFFSILLFAFFQPLGVAHWVLMFTVLNVRR